MFELFNPVFTIGSVPVEPLDLGWRQTQVRHPRLIALISYVEKIFAAGGWTFFDKLADDDDPASF